MGMNNGSKRRVSGNYYLGPHEYHRVCVADSLRLIAMFPLVFFSFGGMQGGWGRVSCSFRLTTKLLW